MCSKSIVRLHVGLGTLWCHSNVRPVRNFKHVSCSSCQSSNRFRVKQSDQSDKIVPYSNFTVSWVSHKISKLFISFLCLVTINQTKNVHGLHSGIITFVHIIIFFLYYSMLTFLFSIYINIVCLFSSYLPLYFCCIFFSCAWYNSMSKS